MNIFRFILNGVIFGAGLAMDAFTVSMADGVCEKDLTKHRVFLIAGTFGLFQTLMPLLGWFLVRTVLDSFRVLNRFVPWIALALLLFLGIRMILEGVRDRKEEVRNTEVTLGMLLLQGVATSIDALSVGLADADYVFREALGSSLIIGLVTFLICSAGVAIGHRIGMKLKNGAAVFGGIILVLIGVEIFVTGIFGC